MHQQPLKLYGLLMKLNYLKKNDKKIGINNE